ncbi:MAG: MOSC domain-containing protein [Chloroflexota bacterium]|nr:MOSC domain-containing protein [Chloroflexota bacterium]MDQ6906332.1 MOSC domain-containing protein [Chloroflexota bacterium]
MKRELTGQVARVLVGRDTVSLVTTSDTTIEITMEGVAGDKHAGITRLSDSRTPWFTRGTVIRNSRQVSLVAAEDLERIAAALELPVIEPEWLGANLVLRDIPDFSHLPPGSRLFFPDAAVLVVTEQNFPCIQPGRVIQEQYPDATRLAQQFPKAALHLRGIVACVERPGTIRAGDTVRVDVIEQAIYCDVLGD